MQCIIIIYQQGGYVRATSSVLLFINILVKKVAVLK